jgi:uncharacterized protein (TIGR00251 family)
MAGWYVWEGEDLVLRLRVQPRASRDRIVGVLGDSLKVTLTAPPVEGKANAHLVKLLAKACKVPAGAVDLEAGEGGRDKRVRIHAPRALPDALGECAQGPGSPHAR